MELVFFQKKKQKGLVCFAEDWLVGTQNSASRPWRFSGKTIRVMELFFFQKE
jgi:hypothetical protein